MNIKITNIRGMTLVEVLVSAFICLMVITMASLVLIGGIRFWVTSMDSLYVQQQARLGLEAICTDLYQAKPGADFSDIVIDSTWPPWSTVQNKDFMEFKIPTQEQNSVPRDSIGNYVSTFSMAPPVSGGGNTFYTDSYYHSNYFYHNAQNRSDVFYCLFVSQWGAGMQSGNLGASRRIKYYLDDDNKLIRGVWTDYGGMGFYSDLSVPVANNISSVAFTGWANNPSGAVPASDNPDFIDISVTASKATIFGDTLSYSTKTRVYVRGSTGDSYFF